MSKADKVKVEFINSSRENTGREPAGVAAKDFFDDKYWERRCHQAEAQLQEIARELERVRGALEEKLAMIASLEQDNRMLSARLDMVHLIFGRRG